MGKLLVVIVALSIIGVGCSAKPVHSVETVAASSPQSGTDQSAQEPVKSVLLENEKKIWNAFKVKDASAIHALLADDVQVVTENGRFNKSTFMRIVPELEIPSYTISNPTVISPSKDVAILTYDCQYTSREQRLTTHSSFQTTVWANRGGKWLAVFNQETPR